MKEPRLEGVKFLLLEKLDPSTMKGKKDWVVAMDAVGAGVGEIVFFVSGSSSRQTDVTTGVPSDATVIAIVDNIEFEDELVYEKGRSGK